MNLTITNSLTEAELALVRETDRDRLAGLDEDALPICTTGSAGPGRST